MRLVTLNVRNPSFDDGPNAWPHRRATFYDVLRRLNPDVLCFQETIAAHVEETARELRFPTAYGVPREVGENAEMCAIFAHAPVAAEGTEWLCDTPDVPGAKGWGAACPRVVTWADLGSWGLYNVHLDHVSQEARTQGMAQIVRRADSFGKPCLIVGDFNATPEEPALELARAAGFRDLAEDAGPTYDGFGGAKAWEGQLGEIEGRIARARRLAEREEDAAKKAELLVQADRIEQDGAAFRTLAPANPPPAEKAVRIDYILARGPWTCERAWVERDAPPYSDHRAVVADLTLSR